jgi:hypothetical protein
MSDTARSDPKPSSLNPSSLGTNIKKKASRKDYYARRDASRVYLFENFAPWREFKKKHGLKTDTDIAEMLLENFDATKSSHALCKYFVCISFDIKNFHFYSYLLGDCIFSAMLKLRLRK